MSVNLADSAATERLAEQLAEALPQHLDGWTVLLAGELGAGKSTFARALIRAMGHEGPVPSPTYTLVEPYELPGGTIYHIDLYRIAAADELRYLGFAETDDGLRLIEWPERVPAVAETADLRIALDYADGGRAAAIAGLSLRGRDVAAAMGSKSD